jgi:hypothetical protein
MRQDISRQQIRLSPDGLINGCTPPSPYALAAGTAVTEFRTPFSLCRQRNLVAGKMPVHRHNKAVYNEEPANPRPSASPL